MTKEELKELRKGFEATQAFIDLGLDLVHQSLFWYSEKSGQYFSTLITHPHTQVNAMWALYQEMHKKVVATIDENYFYGDEETCVVPTADILQIFKGD